MTNDKESMLGRSFLYTINNCRVPVITKTHMLIYYYLKTKKCTLFFIFTFRIYNFFVKLAHIKYAVHYRYDIFV